MHNRDVSKEVVVVLLLLTVIVAVLGTISVTKTAASIQITNEVKNSESNKVSGLVISEPEKPQIGRASITFLTQEEQNQEEQK